MTGPEALRAETLAGLLKGGNLARILGAKAHECPGYLPPLEVLGSYVQGYLADKKTPPSQDHHRALGIFLL